MRLTSNTLAQAYNIPLSIANSWYPSIMDAATEYRLTEKETYYLIAQMAYETSLFRLVRETMNYTTPERISAVFAKYIKPNELRQFVRNPEALANRVYANRMGNGNEASGDGFRYRGGGGIMLTGKNNYREYSNYCGADLVKQPALIETMDHACRSAAWFWWKNELGKFSEKDDFKGLTRAIVGSADSAPKRERLLYDLIKIAMFNK